MSKTTLFLVHFFDTALHDHDVKSVSIKHGLRTADRGPRTTDWV